MPTSSVSDCLGSPGSAYTGLLAWKRSIPVSAFLADPERWCVGFWAKRWFAEARGYSWIERGAVPLFPEVFGSVMLVGRQGFPEAFCSHQGGLFGSSSGFAATSPPVWWMSFLYHGQFSE